MTGKRRLGRGLDALLGQSFDYDADPNQLLDTTMAIDADHTIRVPSELIHVPLQSIDPNPFQPRRTFDATELASLIESVRVHGVVQPVLVRRVGTRFQLIAGERRLRAATVAGLTELPARVTNADDQQVFELAIVENLQRSDLNAIEKARAFHDYLERYGSTHEELAQRLGVDRSTVSNFIRLLDLPAEVQEMVMDGRISQGHARTLLTIPSSEQQIAAGRRIIAEGLSVRQAEALAGEIPGRTPARRRENPLRTTHVEQLEAMLRECLGTGVEIRLRSKDRGQVIIDFASNDDFERLIELVCGTVANGLAA